jgi:hypothetical protein
MTPQKKKRRWLRTLGIGFGVLLTFLFLFVVAFVFNPLEGTLPDVRDLVPRDVNFFVRKERLADDFAEFPAPRFWAEFARSRGWEELQRSPLADGLRKAGVERSLQEAADALRQVREGSGGWLDVLRDAIGTEIVLAGYEQDYSQTPPRPLAEPRWCCYSRVTWRCKAALGVAAFGIVQSQLRAGGLDLGQDGDLLAVKLPGRAQPLWIKRHLDVVMVSNAKDLLAQTQRLIDGNRDEEPLGRMAAYTDGVVARVEKWAEVNNVYETNAVELAVEPNAYDAFRRFAARWPSPANRDSMNERVLASFLNLKGWQRVTGALLFADETFAATGQVVLNSKQHTSFQSSFYTAESSRRETWLDPFLAMVPESACAAAALRMPAGEFLHAMFDALEDAEKDLLNDSLRRTTFQGAQPADARDLIDKIKVAFQPRTGFVFRRNVPDTSRDEKGELMIPVGARSPMPQVAWVFWLRPNTKQIVDDFVSMLQTYHATFHFRRVWHLQVPFAGGRLPEPVTEFTNPQIPATGEIAMIVFREFFLVSNSGPLIKDILRTRYSADGARSIRQLDEFVEVERELPAELNGMLWLHGGNLVPVFDDYKKFAESTSETPDQDWQIANRPAAEEAVRRARFPQYPSKASMPPAVQSGEFDAAVVAHLAEQWRRERTSFTADDRAQVDMLRSLAGLLRAGYVQLELQNNYIRFQAKLLANFR